MSYFKQLGLAKDPFSSSPDAEFFYRSNGHAMALKRLEVIIRQRRGLSLIVGDSGEGKTTLSRALYQLFDGEDGFVACLMPDPGFRSEFQFLLHLTRKLNIVPSFQSTLDLKDALRQFLYQKSVEEKKTIILIIDNGQNISRENLEVLRMLLDFETSGGKLLQLVILAKTELLGRIQHIRNFTNRISLKYVLNSLDESEIKQMIEFRLSRAGCQDHQVQFSDGSIRLIAEQTQGNPREIIRLCHEAMKALAFQQKAVVEEELIRDVLGQGVNV